LPRASTDSELAVGQEQRAAGQGGRETDGVEGQDRAAVREPERLTQREAPPSAVSAARLQPLNCSSTSVETV
jgi:hypothetical protein